MATVAAAGCATTCGALLNINFEAPLPSAYEDTGANKPKLPTVRHVTKNEQERFLNVFILVSFMLLTFYSDTPNTP